MRLPVFTLLFLLPADGSLYSFRIILFWLCWDRFSYYFLVSCSRMHVILSLSSAPEISRSVLIFQIWMSESHQAAFPFEISHKSYYTQSGWNTHEHMYVGWRCLSLISSFFVRAIFSIALQCLFSTSHILSAWTSAQMRYDIDICTLKGCAFDFAISLHLVPRCFTISVLWSSQPASSTPFIFSEVFSLFPVDPGGISLSEDAKPGTRKEPA